MKQLITDTERTKLLDNAAAKTRGVQSDPLPVVKLYTPDAHAVWLLTELDPEDGDTAYGLSDAGLGAGLFGLSSNAPGTPVARRVPRCLA